MAHKRIETDSFGQVEVPAGALYGAQTQRALENFPVSGVRFSRAFIHALGLVKAACAEVNGELELIPEVMAKAIAKASMAVANGQYDEQFPLDIFQTGSGTSTNMNANEVIAHLASAECGSEVHPNDHVNCSQSSNDVIPTCIHLAACIELERQLLPALAHLQAQITARADELSQQVKTGRTHLMDAMPLTMGQEFGGWAAELGHNLERLRAARVRLNQLALGGTAVGTGVNAPAQFGEWVARALTRLCDIEFHPNPNYFTALSSQHAALELSGLLKALSAALFKISNDLRWMNSGPLAGLGEISLPALQPGSSIMPGKVNPVIPEAVAMVCAQVTGNDAAITMAAQSGNFQLNVMLPVIAHNLLQSLHILTNACQLLGDKAIKGFTVNRVGLAKNLARNPVLVTALNRQIGYAKAAEIAKRAYNEQRPILEVAKEMTDLDDATLAKLLDPKNLV